MYNVLGQIDLYNSLDATKWQVSSRNYCKIKTPHIIIHICYSNIYNVWYIFTNIHIYDMIYIQHTWHNRLHGRSLLHLRELNSLNNLRHFNLKHRNQKIQWQHIGVGMHLYTAMGLLPNTSNCGCVCVGNAGNVFSATAGKQSRHASRHVLDARAVMHAGIGNSRFPLNSAVGEKFPAFPAHAPPAILRIW